MAKIFSLFLSAVILMSGGLFVDSPGLGQDDDATPIDWQSNARGFEGGEGATFRVRCPRDGAAGTIYGTRIYTDDSSICTAAVHAGVISLKRGGRVTIEIRGGRSSYESTTRHGITSTA